MTYNYIDLRDYPSLLNEWSEANTSDSTRLLKNYEYLWKCPQGHDYSLKLVLRIERELKCPYCSGRRILTGFNDVATTDPDIARKFSENSPYSPTELTRGSKRKVRLLCDKEHEYEQTMKNAAILRRGCPYCSGYSKKKGYNDLQTMLPEIAEEYSLDNIIPVEDIWAISSEEYCINVKWVCRKNKNHVWNGVLNQRIKNKLIDFCPYCRGVINEVGVNDLATLYPLLKNEWSSKNEKPLSDYTHQSCYKAIWECEKGHEWESYIFHRTDGGGKCKQCYPNSSNQEIEMHAFLNEFFNDSEIIVNDRKVLEGKELDFYIPSQKIAIEMNGLYWHSEVCITDKNYHYDKWKQCQEKGIQLITIWEDEWKEKQEIAKALIKSKIHTPDSERVAGRKTTVIELSLKDSRTFLAEHHIQGAVDGKYNYALMYGNEVVALMVLNKTPNEKNSYNILRFCSSKNIQGGFSKLLKHATRNIKGVQNFYTFSDNCKSNGNLYRINGFSLDKDLKPDYMYVKGQKKFHKFSYRKERFKKDETLSYKENMTEQQLAKLNNIYKIWDCGKRRWKLEL